MPNHALIVITGHIGKVEELKYMPKGDAVMRFSLAVNTGYGDKKTCSWYDCSIFGKRAETLHQMLGKGKPVTVVGEPSIRKWDSNGKSGTSVSVRVQDVVLLGSRDDRHEADDRPRETQAEQEPMPADDGSVPF